MPAQTIPLGELARLIAIENHRVLPLEEVAAITGFSLRWIERECRADRLKHTHEGHTRGMTLAQVGLLVATRERGVTAPKDKPAEVSSIDSAIAASRRSGAARKRRVA